MTLTPLQEYIESIHHRFKGLSDGAVADYIPELLKSDPEWFGVTLVTVDGHVYQAGESRQPFSIQSISKAFTYGIALEDKGIAEVSRKIDVEPSGEAFNSISLEPDSGRPRNPMINAGAIVATGLVDGENGEQKLNRIMEVFSLYSGRELEIDHDIYQSEKSTGHRNRAISHLLRNYNILEGDPEDTLDAYFKQCSILVNCRDLALMGATLANGGVNPITGLRATTPEVVPKVLGVMATCGMYDYSGNWIFRVGMPAKSGVGGGIVAVLPGQMALAVFSPRLDEKGNSVRGIAVCETMSQDFGLHMLHTTRMTSSTVIRAKYTGQERRSNVERSTLATKLLDKTAHTIQVIEITGDLIFVSAEIVVAEVTGGLENTKYIVLDLTRVTSLNKSATLLFVTLLQSLKSQGIQVILSGIREQYSFRRHLKKQLGSDAEWLHFEYADIDQALEWCEEQILISNTDRGGSNKPVPFLDQPLGKGFSAEELAFLESLMNYREINTGDVLCRKGEEAVELYLLESGQVSVWLQVNQRLRKRLSVLTAGCTIGEAALFDNTRRSADVIADTHVRLLVLEPAKLFSDDQEISLRIQRKLFRNLAQQSAARLVRKEAELRALI